MLLLAPPYLARLEAAHIASQTASRTCSMFSSVTGQEVKEHILPSSYWVENMTSTVKFSSALAQCVKDYPEATAIVETGPHPTLKAPIEEILQSSGVPTFDYFGMCYRGVNDFDSLLNSVGAMIGAGLRIETEKVNATEVVDGLRCSHEPGIVLTDLPSYQ